MLYLAWDVLYTNSRFIDQDRGFDNIAFPIRGHSHIDFTMRACRTGANNENTLYDVSNATDYLGIHPKEGYVSTFRRYSFTEQMILVTLKIRVEDGI